MPFRQLFPESNATRVSSKVAARPVQAALASAGTFAVGAVLPLRGSRTCRRRIEHPNGAP
jgi:hypothetical protein